MLSIKYIAGIYDGEGCFSIAICRTRVSGKRRACTSYHSTICVDNTHFELMHDVGEFLTAHNIRYSFRVQKPRRIGRKPLIALNICARSSVATMCNLLLPFSVVKKAQIRLLLLFIDADIQDYARYYEEMHMLNK